MIAVHFDDVDEFLAELERTIEHEHSRVDRAIVRRTRRYRASQLGVRYVHVISSFVAVAGWPPVADAHLVHVTAFAGELWNHEERDQQTHDRATALMEAIDQACERLELEPRGGFYEVAT